MAADSVPSDSDRHGDDGSPSLPGMAWFPLLIALLLLVLMTVWPRIATNLQGQADHSMAMLLLWSMCAGFVRGVGFVPLHPLPRWLLSTPACLLALALAALRAAS